MNVRVKIKDGKAIWLEYDNNSETKTLEDGVWFGGLQLYTLLKEEVDVICAKKNCMNEFKKKVNSKSRIKYCEKYRRKR